MSNTIISTPTTPPPVSPSSDNGSVKRFLISALRWMLFIPTGLLVTFILTFIVYWVAGLIDSFLPDELSGLIATRASLVVVLPLISAVTVGAAYIAPMHKTGAIIYGLCLGGLRVFNVMYAGESVVFALIYYAPVVFGVYCVLKNKE